MIAAVASKSPVIVGADPELFLYDTAKERMGTAIPFFRGNKARGETLKGIPGGRVLHDNVAVEFNCQPYSTAAEFSEGIHGILKEINTLLIDRASSSYKLVCGVGSAPFPENLLRHPEAQRFGCEPDFNAWTSMRNPSPTPEDVGSMRVIGGHVHIGMHGVNPLVDQWLGTFSGACAIIKLLDATLGQYIARLESESPAKDTFVQRRRYYGGAGAFRKKPYGVEYRTPSSIWLDTKDKTERVFNIISGVLSAAATQWPIDVGDIARRGNTLPMYEELIAQHRVSDDDVIEAVDYSRPIQGLLDNALSF